MKEKEDYKSSKVVMREYVRLEFNIYHDQHNVHQPIINREKI